MFLSRLTLHLDGFHYLVNNTSIHNRLGEEANVPSISQQMSINCVPNLCPVCVIGSLEMSNHAIYTASEFEKMLFVKIDVSNMLWSSTVHLQMLQYLF